MQNFLLPGRALLVSAITLCALAGGAARASAQVAEDAFVRAWMDATFYTGSPGNGPKTTVIAPVLQADLKLLGLVRAGVDIPLVAAFTSSLPNSGTVLSSSGSQFTLGSPTLHGSIEIEAGPLLARAGLGLAVSVRNNDVMTADDFAATTGMLLGTATRGLWNPWWYVDRHTIFAPGEVRYLGQDYAFGVEGALMAAFPRSDAAASASTATAFQIGAYLAAVSGKTSMIGVRFRDLLAFSTGLFGSDKSQSSLEAFAETRVMGVLLLGGGFLVNLDEPFGVFGNGLDIWGARVKAGLAL